jgi:hypothetical protein
MVQNLNEKTLLEYVLNAARITTIGSKLYTVPYVFQAKVLGTTIDLFNAIFHYK